MGAEIMSSKRMGGLGKLSDFSQTEVPSPASTKQSAKKAKADKLVHINIKVLESQQKWLAETAKEVRASNDEPVPAKERVYPQHLIGVAIDLLKTSDINWQEVKNLRTLRQILVLKEEI
jgi:hypothetical protein